MNGHLIIANISYNSIQSDHERITPPIKTKLLQRVITSTVNRNTGDNLSSSKISYVASAFSRPSFKNAFVSEVAS